MLGPLQGAGIDLRGPLIGIYSFPTVVIFCEGLGIATAKALIEATAGVGGLSFPLRRDVRMYYRVCTHCGSLCNAAGFGLLPHHLAPNTGKGLHRDRTCVEGVSP